MTSRGARENVRGGKRRRGQKRGAALVEAALVLPTLAIFLGLIMYEYRSYREKIVAQQTTRSHALFLASHSCEGSSDESGSTGDAQSVSVTEEAAHYGLDSANVNGVDKVLNGSPPDGDAMRAKTSRSFNQARATVTRHAKGGGLARDVRGKSVVFCNEAPQDGDPTGIEKWSFTFFHKGLL